MTQTHMSMLHTLPIGTLGYGGNPTIGRLRSAGATKVETLYPITELPPGPVLVHADALVTRRFAPRVSDRNLILDAHVQALASLTDGRSTYLPTFNYDFCRTGVYDPREDPSQVGDVTEHVRQISTWRTEVPVFHFAGLPGTPVPDLAHLRPGLVVDPFGQGSLFDLLVKESGAILFYGAPLSSFTMIHHIERCDSSGPAYRYDKSFPGIVRRRDGDLPVELVYHVRPAGKRLEYDWEHIEHLLVEAEALFTTEYPQVHWLDARRARQALLEALTLDPFRLLDTSSRSWVRPLVESLGRKLQIDDFET